MFFDFFKNDLQKVVGYFLLQIDISKCQNEPDFKEENEARVGDNFKSFKY